MTEGGDDEVVPTLSRTGNSSSATGCPSSARRTSRPSRRPFSRPGCSTVVSTWSSHGRSTPSNPVTVEVVGDAQAEGLRRPDRAGREEVGLRDDRGGTLRGRDVEEQPGGLRPCLDGQRARLHDGRTRARHREEPGHPAGGVGVCRPLQLVRGHRSGGRARGQGHRQVDDAGVAEVDDVAGDQRHRGGLVGQDVRDAGVQRGAAGDECDPTREEVRHERVVAVPTQREDGCVDGLGGELGHRLLGVFGGLGDEEHRAARGVQLLGQAVEHGQRERVVERQPEWSLHDDGHGPHAALAQRRRQRVGAGVGQVAGCRPHPFGGGGRDRPLAAEDEGGRGRRDAGTAGDVAQGRSARGPGLTNGGHGGHNIESIRSNRFDHRAGRVAPPGRSPCRVPTAAPSRSDPEGTRVLSATPAPTTAPALPRERVTSARTAVFVVFALAGLVFASWASRIADTKAGLGLTAGELGLTLFAASIGSVTGLPLAGRICERVGATRAVALGMAVSLTGLLLVGLVVDARGPRLAVGVGLFLVGLGVGVWDVSMNLEGAGVERELGTSVMPHFHAAFSGGTVVLGPDRVGDVVGRGPPRAALPRCRRRHRGSRLVGPPALPAPGGRAAGGRQGSP